MKRTSLPTLVSSLLPGLVLLLGLAPAATPQTADGPALDERLEGLCEELERRREEGHIPGMALAIVKDESIVLARGFGLADRERGIPVTPETIFAAGSTTKAFTATVIAMLVEEGRMDLDAPATDYLPWFTLQADFGDDPDAAVTVRDLLCHRTGFTRMNGLLMSNDVSQEEILRTATKAEPWAPFRERFYYNNVMYLASGVCAEAATGEAWSTLVKRRLLDPLGMETASLSVAAAQHSPHLAVGYDWDEDEGVFEPKEMRELDTIAPAGALNASVLDMAAWIRFQLGRGAIDGRRLLSEELHAETWTPQAGIGAGVQYGLGWMLREWQGCRVIEHGGNIDGFSAQVALMPDEGLGFVLLFNVSAAPLQATSLGLVWEALVADPEPVASGGAVDYADYVGEYVANFAHFDDEIFTVLEKNGRLAVDVPSQMIFEMKDPDEEGKWVFSLTDTIAVSFDRDAEGRVNGMKMYQGGFTFEIPRKGAEPPAPAIPLADLERYLGHYRIEERGDVEVLIRNNRLTVAIPELALELLPPDAEDRWVARVRDDIWVVFEEDDRDAVISFLLHRPEGAPEQLAVRADVQAAEDVPSLEEVLALRGNAERGRALRALGGYDLQGTIRKAQSGVEGRISIRGVGTERMRQELDFGKFGFMTMLVDGDRGWMTNSVQPTDEIVGRMLEQTRRSHVGPAVSDWYDYYDEVRVLRTDVDGDRPVIVVQLSGRDLPPTVARIDAETGDTLHERRQAVITRNMKLPMTVRYADWREVDGLRVPFSITLEDEATGRTEMRFESLEKGLALPGAIFRLEEPAEGDAEVGREEPVGRGPDRLDSGEVGADEAFRHASPESQGLDPAALETLAAVVRRFVDEDEIVGAELAVLKNRRVVLHEAYGLRDAVTGEPMVRDTIHNVRSMTKPVTGMVAQTLIEEGRLGLDDRVADHLPSFEREGLDEITVRHLLTHRSGLPLTTLDVDFRSYTSLAEIAADVAEVGPEFHPGSRFQYSDAGCETLGAVLEAVTGETLDELVRTRVLEPLGMHDALAKLDPDDPRHARVASLHVGSKGDWQRIWEPGGEPFYPVTLGSQSLYCTPLDYARFLASWMDGGVVGDRRLLSAETVERALEPASTLPWPTVPEELVLGYGELWMVYHDGDPATGAPRVAFGHSGSDGTWALAWPELDLMVLFFTQSRGQHTINEFERAVDALLVHPDAAAAAELLAPRPEHDTSAYLGFFWSASESAYRFVDHSPDGELRVFAPGLGIFALEPTEDADVWMVEQLKKPLRFLRAENGAVVGIEPPELTNEEPWTRLAVDPELPDTGEVMRRHREGQGCEALEGFGAARLTGTLRIPARGVEASIEMLADGGERYRRTLVLGGRELATACDGENVWSNELTGSPALLEGQMRAQALEGGLGFLFGDWRHHFADVRVLYVTDAFGDPAFAVHVVSRSGRPAVRYLDVETGLAVAVHGFATVPGIGPIGITLRFDDVREVDGVRLPFGWHTSYRGLFDASIEFEAVETGVAVSDEDFRLAVE